MRGIHNAVVWCEGSQRCRYIRRMCKTAGSQVQYIKWLSMCKKIQWVTAGWCVLKDRNISEWVKRENSQDTRLLSICAMIHMSIWLVLWVCVFSPSTVCGVLCSWLNGNTVPIKVQKITRMERHEKILLSFWSKTRDNTCCSSFFLIHSTVEDAAIW